MSDNAMNGKPAPAQSSKVLILHNLDCASCAARIEKAVRAIGGVRDASVDFASGRLLLEFDNHPDLDPILEQVHKAAVRIEPGIRVIDASKAGMSRSGTAIRSAAAHDWAHHDQAPSRQSTEHRHADDPIGEHAGASVDEQDHEQGDAPVSRLHVLRLTLGTILFAIAFLSSLAGPVELALYLAAYFLIGGSVLLRAARNIVHGQVFDEHFLMSIATIGAFAIREYPEAVVVMLFYEIGELLESLAVGRSRRSISALMQIRPDYANLWRGGELVRVSPADVEIGSRIAVKPGERIPLDGRIVEGTTLLDTSAITGESMPREAGIGDTVFAGSINRNGLFTVEVTRSFGESTVSRILDLVQNASSHKAPTEKFITRFAQRYTPIVVIAAALLAVVPPLVVPGAQFSDWFYRALAFLVVSCPCALVISIPLGYFGGIGAASRRGILIKGSNYLEALNQVGTVVFDKTGTLTQGVFQVSRIEPAGNPVGDGSPEAALLALAAHAEAYSSHPIAQSIVSAYGADRIRTDRIRSYDDFAGQGIRAVIDGRTVFAGSARFLASAGIEVPAGAGSAPTGRAASAPTGIAASDRSGMAASGANDESTAVHLAVDGRYAGAIRVADQVKPDAREAVDKLKAIGIERVVMLTGDTPAVGERIARSLGIDDVRSGLLPDQKVAEFERLAQNAPKSARGRIAFVGDGINDAPVLARADVGISMGALGSDAAIEAANVVIMTDHPSKVADAICIARHTNRIVWQNVVFALGVKAAVLLLSAGGIAGLWEAVFADMGVALIAIFNAMRVLNASVPAESQRQT